MRYIVGTVLQILGGIPWLFFGTWLFFALHPMLVNVFGSFFGFIFWIFGGPIITLVFPILYWLFGGFLNMGIMYMKIWGLTLAGFLVMMTGSAIKE